MHCCVWFTWCTGPGVRGGIWIRTAPGSPRHFVLGPLRSTALNRTTWNDPPPHLCCQQLTTAWNHKKLSFLFLAGNLLPFPPVGYKSPGDGINTCFSLPALWLSLCKSPSFRKKSTNSSPGTKYCSCVVCELRIFFTHLIGWKTQKEDLGGCVNIMWNSKASVHKWTWMETAVFTCLPAAAAALGCTESRTVATRTVSLICKA